LLLAQRVAQQPGHFLCCCKTTLGMRCHLNKSMRQLRVVHVCDVVAVLSQFLRIVMRDVAEHIESSRHQNRFRKSGMALRVHGRDVGLRVIDTLWHQTPYKEQDARRIYITAGNIFHARAGEKRHFGFRVDRHLQRQLRTVFISQLETDRAGDVAAGRVSAQSDAFGIDPALCGVLEEPANDKFSLFDLGRPLILCSPRCKPGLRLSRRTAAWRCRIDRAYRR
jgi:hypothetical protein